MAVRANVWEIKASEIQTVREQKSRNYEAIRKVTQVRDEKCI